MDSQTPKYWKFCTHHQCNLSSFLAQAGRWDVTFRPSRMLDSLRWKDLVLGEPWCVPWRAVLRTRARADVSRPSVLDRMASRPKQVATGELVDGRSSTASDPSSPDGWCCVRPAVEACARRLHAWHRLGTGLKTFRTPAFSLGWILRKLYVIFLTLAFMLEFVLSL